MKMQLFGEYTSHINSVQIIGAAMQNARVVRSWRHRNPSFLLNGAAALVLVLATLVRVAQLDYPKNPEVYRDYLISSHIAAYDERPLTGPSNQIFPILRNSFDYPYLLAFFLEIGDNILFLSVVNIFLQLLNLLFFYLLGKKLFGGGTALIALGLYAFSHQGIAQSSEIWAPYLVPLFINVSFLLLLAGLKKKNYALLIASIFFFAVSFTFHYSVFALLPLFLVAIFLILRHMGKPLWSYVLAAGSLFFFLLLFYFPTLVYLSKISFTAGNLELGKIFVGSLPEYMHAFATNLQTLIRAFFLDYDGRLSDVLLVVIGCTGVLYCLLIYRADRMKKIILLLMLLAILQPLLFSALFQTTRWAYYFTSIFGFFLLLVADIINVVFAKKPALIAIKIILIILLIKVFSPNFYFARANQNLNTSWHTQNAAITAIYYRILSLQKSEHYGAPDFFQFWVIRSGNSFHDYDAHFWAGLEKKFDTKFTETIDSLSGYRALNTNDYIFVSCQDFMDRVNEKSGCLDLFSRQNENYAFIGHIFDQYPYSIYVAKNTYLK